jgi:hypothetical protein
MSVGKEKVGWKSYVGRESFCTGDRRSVGNNMLVGNHLCRLDFSDRHGWSEIHVPDRPSVVVTCFPNQHVCGEFGVVAW